MSLLTHLKPSSLGCAHNSSIGGGGRARGGETAMKARDVMVSPVITVEPTASVKDVAKLFLERGSAPSRSSTTKAKSLVS
jgi:CBS domain-containing protein